MKRLDRVQYMFAYIIFNILLETLAYTQLGIFSKVASRIWLITAIFGVVYFCYLMLCEIQDDIRNRRILFLVSAAVVVGFLACYVVTYRYSTVSYESCIQLGAGYKAYKKDDWGYTLTAFLGYPLRQYVIAALPAKILGNTILALRLGYIVPFFIGLISLMMEYKKELKENNADELFAIVFVLFIISFRFVSEFFSIFEQTIVPISLTMIATALFLKMRRKANCLDILCISWIGGMLVTSYTPSLASAGLLMVFLMLLFLKELNEKGKNIIHTPALTYPLICVQIVIYWVLTITNKYADRQVIRIKETDDYLKYWMTIVIEFFTDKNAVFFGIFMIIILAYLVLSFCFCLKFYNFLIAGWSICVSIMSVITIGYADYDGDFLFYHRNLIIIPVIITGIFMFLLPYLRKVRLRQSLILCSVWLLGLNYYHFTQYYQGAVFLNGFEDEKYMINLLEDAMKECDISFDDEFNIYARLGWDDVGVGNLHDFREFLFPNCNIVNLVNEPDARIEGRAICVSKDEDFLKGFGIVTNKKEYHNYKNNKDFTYYWGYSED